MDPPGAASTASLSVTSTVLLAKDHQEHFKGDSPGRALLSMEVGGFLT